MLCTRVTNHVEHWGPQWNPVEFSRRANFIDALHPELGIRMHQGGAGIGKKYHTLIFEFISGGQNTVKII